MVVAHRERSCGLDRECVPEGGVVRPGGNAVPDADRGGVAAGQGLVEVDGQGAHPGDRGGIQHLELKPQAPIPGHHQLVGSLDLEGPAAGHPPACHQGDGTGRGFIQSDQPPVGLEIEGSVECQAAPSAQIRATAGVDGPTTGPQGGHGERNLGPPTPAAECKDLDQSQVLDLPLAVDVGVHIAAMELDRSLVDQGRPDRELVVGAESNRAGPHLGGSPEGDVDREVQQGVGGVEHQAAGRRLRVDGDGVGSGLIQHGDGVRGGYACGPSNRVGPEPIDGILPSGDLKGRGVKDGQGEVVVCGGAIPGDRPHLDVVIARGVVQRVQGQVCDGRPGPRRVGDSDASERDERRGRVCGGVTHQDQG